MPLARLSRLLLCHDCYQSPGCTSLLQVCLKQLDTRHLMWPVQQQHLSTSSFQLSHPHQQQQRDVGVLKLYKGRWIHPARFVVRGKVFQLIGGGSLGLLLASLAMEEASMTDIGALAAVAGGMVAASCCMWYYSRRYVGEMALMLPDAQRVRFSVLDFWGNREDVVVPMSSLQPPFKGVRKKEVDRLANQILFPINIQGDRQFYLSIHSGILLQPQVFMSILTGNFTPQDHPPVQAALEEHQQQCMQQHTAGPQPLPQHDAEGVATPQPGPSHPQQPPV